MDRLLRLGGGMPGLNQGPPPSDAPVVDTAEQVQYSLFKHLHPHSLHIRFIFHFQKGVYIFLGSLENA